MKPNRLINQRSPFQEEARKMREQGLGLDFESTAALARDLEKTSLRDVPGRGVTVVSPKDPVTRTGRETFIRTDQSPTGQTTAVEDAVDAAETQTGLLTEAQKAAQIGRDIGASEDVIKQAGFEPGTTDELEFLAEQRRDREFFEARQKAAQREQLVAGKQQAERVGRRAVSATGTALGQGREGVQIGARGLTLPKITSETQQRITLASKRVDQAVQALDENEKQLKAARDRGDAKALKNLQAQRTQLETLKNQSQLALEEQAAKETSAAQANLEMMQDNPLMLANASPDMIGTMLENAGFDRRMASGLIAEAKLAQQTKGVEAEQAVANLQKTLADISQIGRVDPTTDQKNFDFYQKLQKSDPAAAEEFAQLTGISEKPLSPIDQKIKELDLQIKSTKNEQEKIKLLEQKADLEDYQGYTQTNRDVVAASSNLTSNMTADEAYEVAGITRLGGEKFKGECAAYVNDMIGSLKYGSTLQEKRDRITNSNVFAPTVGSVFISSLSSPQSEAAGKPTGHVGFVEKVDIEAGTVTLSDFNRYGKQKFNRREVPISKLVDQEKIIGYENLAFSSKKDATKKTEMTKFLEEAEGLGITSPKEKRKYAMDQIKEFSKDMDQTERKSFNAYIVGTEQERIIEEAMKDQDKEEFADAIGFLQRQTKEDSLTADLIRQATDNEGVQRVLLAEMRWIDAILREESGAAITVEEYLTKGLANFPRPGDSETVINDKKSARDTATKVRFNTMGRAGQRIYETQFKEPEIPTAEDLSAKAQERAATNSLQSGINSVIQGGTQGTQQSSVFQTALGTIRPQGQITVIRSGKLGFIPPNEFNPQTDKLQQ